MKMKVMGIIVGIIVLMASLPWAFAGDNQVAVSFEVEGARKIHRMRSGDTIGQLVKDLDVSLEDIRNLNPHVPDLDRVPVGTEIVLPLFTEPQKLKYTVPISINVPPPAASEPEVKIVEVPRDVVRAPIPYQMPTSFWMAIGGLTLVILVSTLLVLTRRPKTGNQQTETAGEKIVIDQLPVSQPPQHIAIGDGEEFDDFAARVKKLPKEQTVLCPYNCGIKIMAQNFSRHVHAHCPNRPQPLAAAVS